MRSYQILYGTNKILKMSALILICYWIIKLAIAVVQKTCLCVRPLLYLPLAATGNNIVSVINGSQGNYICVGLAISF